MRGAQTVSQSVGLKGPHLVMARGVVWLGQLLTRFKAKGPSMQGDGAHQAHIPAGEGPAGAQQSARTYKWTTHAQAPSRYKWRRVEGEGSQRTQRAMAHAWRQRTQCWLHYSAAGQAATLPPLPHTRAHTHAHARTHMHQHAHTHMRTHTHTHARAHTHTHSHTHGMPLTTASTVGGLRAASVREPHAPGRARGPPEPRLEQAAGRRHDGRTVCQGVLRVCGRGGRG